MPTLLQKLFKVTGFYPYNPNVFPMKDFAPSRVSSILVHVSNKSPAKISSSDPMEDNSSVSLYNSKDYSDKENNVDGATDNQPNFEDGNNSFPQSSSCHSSLYNDYARAMDLINKSQQELAKFQIV
ncbi:hypothetical protein B0H34DRAFT_672137 [Crassisporium funariophilum]|nr:hypothetical protein B0H34DRAFT_672137 [Crassisporium funariophilum]